MTKLCSSDGRKSPSVPKLINSNVRGSKQGWKTRVNSQLAGNSGVVVGKCREILPKRHPFMPESDMKCILSLISF